MSFGVRVWIVIVILVLVCLRGVVVWLEVAVSQALPRSEEYPEIPALPLVSPVSLGTAWASSTTNFRP